MPFDQVFHKFKEGALHSGSKSGPKVTNRKQAIAIYLSEKGKAPTHPEYRAKMKRSPKPKQDGLARKKAKYG